MQHLKDASEIDPGQWMECEHLPTRQKHLPLTAACNVETLHGTMSGRAGDHLMLGTDGEMYLITEESFARNYVAPGLASRPK